MSILLFPYCAFRTHVQCKCFENTFYITFLILFEEEKIRGAQSK